MQSVLVAMTLCLVCGADGDGDAAKKELAELGGEWSLVSGERDGQALPAALVEGATRVTKGDETTVMVGGQLFMKATFTIDPTKKPKTIDYTITDGPNKGKKQLGIYARDGDTVTFCFALPGKDRPTDLTAKADSGRTLSAWKRDKK